MTYLHYLNKFEVAAGLRRLNNHTLDDRSKLKLATHEGDSVGLPHRA